MPLIISHPSRQARHRVSLQTAYMFDMCSSLRDSICNSRPVLILSGSLPWRRNHAELLQQTQEIHFTPVFHDPTIRDTIDTDPGH